MGNQRAEYGKGIISKLAIGLTHNYGSNFSEKNIRRMIQFAEVFPDAQIVASAIRQLSWTHLSEYMTELPSKNLLKQKLHDALEVSKKRFENI